MKVRVLVLAALCVATSAFLVRAQQVERIPVKRPLVALPLTLSDWQGQNEAPLSKPILDVLGVDEYVTRTYWRHGGPPVGLYVGYYASQRQGDTIHSPLNCLPGAGWIPMEQGRVTLAVPSQSGTRAIEVNRVVIQKGLDRTIVLYWYQGHGRVVASEYWGKVYTVVDAIRQNRTDAALVRVLAPVPAEGGNSVGAADAAARSFTEALFSVLEQHLPS